MTLAGGRDARALGCVIPTHTVPVQAGSVQTAPVPYARKLAPSATITKATGVCVVR